MSYTIIEVHGRQYFIQENINFKIPTIFSYIVNYVLLNKRIVTFFITTMSYLSTQSKEGIPSLRDQIEKEMIELLDDPMDVIFWYIFLIYLFLLGKLIGTMIKFFLDLLLKLVKLLLKVLSKLSLAQKRAILVLLLCILWLIISLACEKWLFSEILDYLAFDHL